MANLSKIKQSMSKLESKNYAKNYFLENISDSAKVVHTYQNNDNNVNNDNFAQIYNNEQQTQYNPIKNDENYNAYENIHDNKTLENNELTNKKPIVYDDNFTENFNNPQNYLNYSNIEEVKREDFPVQYKNKDVQMDIYSLLDEFNLEKDLISNKDNDDSADIFNYLSRNKIEEIIKEKFGHCNEKLLDELHSRAIINNWKELDIQKWIMDPSNKYVIEHENSNNKNDVNEQLDNTETSKSVPNIQNQIKNVQPIFKKDFDNKKNYYEKSDDYRTNIGIDAKIDQLFNKVENLDKNFKNTLIEENYRKLMIDNQTEILKNFFNEKINNFNYLANPSIHNIKNGINQNSGFNSNLLNSINNQGSSNGGFEIETAKDELNKSFNEFRKEFDEKLEKMFNKILDIKKEEKNDISHLIKNEYQLSNNDNNYYTIKPNGESNKSFLNDNKKLDLTIEELVNGNIDADDEVENNFQNENSKFIEDSTLNNEEQNNLNNKHIYENDLSNSINSNNQTNIDLLKNKYLNGNVETLNNTKMDYSNNNQVEAKVESIHNNSTNATIHENNLNKSLNYENIPKSNNLNNQDNGLLKNINSSEKINSNETNLSINTDLNDNDYINELLSEITFENEFNDIFQNELLKDNESKQVRFNDNNLDKTNLNGNRLSIKENLKNTNESLENTKTQPTTTNNINQNLFNGNSSSNSEKLITDTNEEKKKDFDNSNKFNNKIKVDDVFSNKEIDDLHKGTSLETIKETLETNDINNKSNKSLDEDVIKNDYYNNETINKELTNESQNSNIYVNSNKNIQKHKQETKLPNLSEIEEISSPTQNVSLNDKVEESNETFSLGTKNYINHENKARSYIAIDRIDFNKFPENKINVENKEQPEIKAESVKNSNISNLNEDNLNNLKNSNYNLNLDNNQNSQIIDGKIKEQEKEEKENKDLAFLEKNNKKIDNLMNATISDIEEMIFDLGELNINDETISDVVELKDKFKNI